MLSDTFHDRGSMADDPDLSVALTRSMATFRRPEILYFSAIFHDRVIGVAGPMTLTFPSPSPGPRPLSAALKFYI